MMYRLALAALLSLWTALASAQFATIGPTPPISDNGDRLATTAFVNNFLAGGLPLANGNIFIGSVGGLAVGQTMSGDATLIASGALTLATVNGNVGTFGSATQCITTTQNAKGLTTAISAANCTPAIGSITGLGTGVATALAVNVGTAGAPVVNGGALGTPSSGVGTNLTGTAAGLTAGNATLAATVTTNANLTGPVTSVGNATTIGANQVTRAMEAQGIARSVVGVTGNSTANVADIQGAANQALVVNSGGTALTFGSVNLAAAAAVTGALPFANGGNADTGTAPGAFTPSPSCGTATFTVNSAKFRLLQAKITWVEIDFTITAIGTCTSTINFTLPNTPNSSGGMIGKETVTTGKGVFCGLVSASTTSGCSLSDVTNFANTQRIVATGVYENQ